MTFVSNVFETTTTTGTGAYTPAGAVTGARTFLTAYGGSTVYNVPYVCRDSSNYEVGFGTWNGTTLARTLVLESSNSGSAVSWGAGTRDLFSALGAISSPSSSYIDVATAASIAALDPSNSSVVRLTGSTATTVQGVLAGTYGQIVNVYNVSSAAVTLSHENGSASAANRIVCPGSVSAIVAAGKSASLVYDKVQARWIVMTPEYRPAQIKSYTASGTWTKGTDSPVDAQWALIEVWGAGGGGAGSTSASISGGGGAGGGYAQRLVAVASLGATETVTVGAGGVAININTASNGNAGGTSSFGSWASATGGGGGQNNQTLAAGGTGSSGDLNVQGGWGGATPFNGLTASYGPGGAGARGGAGGLNYTVGSTPGGGGGGGNSTASSGAGAVGRVQILFF